MGWHLASWSPLISRSSWKAVDLLLLGWPASQQSPHLGLQSLLAAPCSQLCLAAYLLSVVPHIPQVLWQQPVCP